MFILLVTSEQPNINYKVNEQQQLSIYSSWKCLDWERRRIGPNNGRGEREREKERQWEQMLRDYTVQLGWTFFWMNGGERTRGEEEEKKKKKTYQGVSFDQPSGAAVSNVARQRQLFGMLLSVIQKDGLMDCCCCVNIPLQHARFSASFLKKKYFWWLQRERQLYLRPRVKKEEIITISSTSPFPRFNVHGDSFI